MIRIASGKCPLVECSDVREQLLLSNMHGMAALACVGMIGNHIAMAMVATVTTGFCSFTA